jgi:hypothetical protein
MADSNVFTPLNIPGPAGDPIVVTITGPDSVVAGQQFSYTVKVLDKDGKNFLNPTGIDPSVAINFQITSMSQFQFNIAPGPDSGGNLVCNIAGVAQSVPGIYEDSFRGFNTQPGITQDAPVIETHLVTVKVPG